MANGLTEEDVRHVAKLSRLKLSDEEVGVFAEQLGAVLGYMDKLKELDLEGVEEMAHPTNMVNKLRLDEVGASLDVEEVLANAPASDEPYFKVPKVLGDGGSA